MIVLANLLCLGITPLAMLYAVIGVCKTPVCWKKFFPFLLISVFILGYAYVPTGTPDLTRYVEVVKNIQHMELKQTIAFLNDNLYVENFYFWLIGTIGDLQLLAAIPVTVVYGTAIYITCDTASTYKCENYIPMLLIFQIMMMPFFSILNNVRCITSFALVILATYLDIVKKVKRTFLIPLYVLPCFFHFTAIILLVFRLSLFAANKIRWIIIISALFLPNAVDILYANSSIIHSDIMRSLIIRIYWYFHDSLKSEYSRRIAASGANKVQKILFFALVVFVIVLIYFSAERIIDHYKSYNTFVLLLCVAVLGCAPVNTPQYWRFTAAVMVAGISSVFLPVLINAENRLQRQITMLFMAFEAIGGLSIQIWNSRYIVDYADWIIRFFLTDIYIIIGNIFRLIYFK